MRAVNLIPMDARRGADAPSRSGGVVYGVLGILGVIAVMSMMYAVTRHQVADREAEAKQLTADAAKSEAQATALAPYSKFAKTAQARESTVAAIADARFDWGASLREIARVIPGQVDLVSLTGTKGGQASSSSATSAGAPQFQLIGCAPSQSQVALLLARLRAIDAVDSVNLSQSDKADSSGSGQPSGSASDCRTSKDDVQFTLTVVFATESVPAAAGSPGTSTASTGQTSTAAAQPAGTEGAS